MLPSLQPPIKDIIAKKQNSIFIAPHALLRSYIAHYTLMFPGGEKKSDMLTLIPDASGCIVFSFDGNNLESKFWGPTTKAVTLVNDIYTIPFRFFVEFLPCGAYHFTGIPQAELTDLQLKAETIVPSLADQIRQSIEKAHTVKELIEHLDKVFLKCLSAADTSLGVTQLVPMIQQLKGNVSVQEISQETFYSERHLNRIFHKLMGMSTKKYIRLLRVNQILERIKQFDLPLTFLAQEAGYYDQAHFNHDFKSVCGVTPTVYRANMSGFYNEDYKF